MRSIRKMVAFRLEEPLLDAVDKARGDVSRTRFVERALEAALGQEKGPGGGSGSGAKADESRVSVGHRVDPVAQGPSPSRVPPPVVVAEAPTPLKGCRTCGKRVEFGHLCKSCLRGLAR